MLQATDATRLTARPAPEGTRRRHRWWVPAALGAVAVATAVVAGSLAPLASPGPVLATGTAVTPLDDFGDRGSVVLLYEDGREVAYAFRLRNDGWLPLRVTGVDLPDPAEQPLLVPTGLETTSTSLDRETTIDELDTVAFAPFTLWPGAARTLVVRGRLDNCAFYTERSLALIGAHTVQAGVGVTRSRHVVLGDDVVVRSPGIRRCPGRVLDRSARQR
jgi:hypothetical protein